MKILIIEDEKELADSIAMYLSGQNYLCEMAHTYKRAMSKIVTFDYDCILLDLTLPGGDGIKILEEIKEQKRKAGVIIISGKSSVDDKIKGLQTGADDYLTKPFHLSELAARIFSVIRRKQFSNTNVVEQQEIKIDLLGKTVTVNNMLVSVTNKEFQLLLYLISNKNRVVSKSALAEHISGDMADMLNNHDFIYVHIKNLKKKLSKAGAENYITTVYGAGYKWEG